MQAHNEVFKPNAVNQPGAITGRQIRAALGALGWSLADLADQSGLSWATIQRMAKTNDVPNVMAGNLEIARRVLVEAGIEFLPGGVVLRELEAA